MFNIFKKKINVLILLIFLYLSLNNISEFGNYTEKISSSDEKFNISKDKIMVISMAAQELASYYEVVLNKYKSQRKRAPLTPEEMKHILDVAEEMDNRQKELQQDEILDDEFSGYKFTSKKLN